MSKEQDFYAALREVFVGAEIEGESGYINLMRMKSRYFQEIVFPQLHADIEAVVKAYSNFRDELFDKLYDFFHRYFSESGSIYFRRTRYPQSVYEQVYADEKDVILFWKTHMLYYVKTDRLFRSMEVEVPLRVKADPATATTQRFFFDVTALEHKQANEKRELVYRFDHVREDGTLVFAVEYSSYGSKTKLLDILKALRDADAEVDADVQVGEDVLQRAFRVFEKQSEVDFFINKDAKRFLKEQFDLWMYRYLFEGENIWLQRRLEMLQRLKELAYKIIDFIAQFEDELVRVWNKPKFVRDSHYVITLDHVAARDAELLGRVLAHAGMAEQVAEWRELGMVSADFTPEDVWARDLFGEKLDARYQYLPLDTRHLPDLELEIVGLFEHLDEALDGWLIHSENYQALNTLRPRFRGRVKCIYIDPPYNTGNDEFIYRDRYQHSAWLTMMENRLGIAQDLLGEEGLIFLSIDENEVNNLMHLLSQIFAEKVGIIVVKNNPKGRSLDRYLSTSHEYLVAFAKGQTELAGIPKGEERLSEYTHQDDEGRYRLLELRNTHRQFNRETRPNLWYPLYINSQTKTVSLEPSPGDQEIYPVWADGLEGCWTWGRNRVREKQNLLIGRKVNGRWKIYRKDYARGATYTPKTIWADRVFRTDYAQSVLDDLLGARIFQSPKPPGLIERASRLSSDPGQFILDFFAGSGTTAHAVMNLNREDGGRRKYILVEMGEHFETVILPRVKKVAFSSEWKDGAAQEGGEGMSHFVKYYALEQYEDTLRNAAYIDDATTDAEPFADPYTDVYQQYVFLADLKQLHALEIDPETRAARVNLAQLYPDIDLAETLANLRGKRIARLTAEAVEFEDGERIDLRDPDWELIKPLIWW